MYIYIYIYTYIYLDVIKAIRPSSSSPQLWLCGDMPSMDG